MILTPAEQEKAFKKVTKGMKHVKVNGAVAQFMYDNGIISRGTSVDYAKLKSVALDGTITIDVYPKLKFSFLTAELLK
jgi:tryptophan synthase alpha subunit